MRRLTIAILLLMTFGVSIGLAQDTLRARWGLFGGLGINTHTADFRALPGVPNCCPQFESGSGTGPIAGLQYEFPIAGSLLLSFAGSYMDHSAQLLTREPVAVVNAGEVRVGAFEHTIDATFASIGFEPTLSLRLMDGLFVRGGFRIGAILSPEYSQKEEIVEPARSGTFLDSLGNDTGLRTRNRNAGAIPDASSLLVQGVAGLEYELPINSAHTLLLVPGISYAPGFTDVVDGNTWKPNALRLALGLKYSPLPSREIRRDTIYRRDTAMVNVARGAAPAIRLDNRMATSELIDGGPFDLEHVTIAEHYVRDVPKTSLLAATVTAVGLENGHEEPVATLRIEEFLRTNTHPLLGYVFFGEASSELPDRYARITASDADRFKPSALFGENAMGISHNVLNIVGYNLRQRSDAQLTITGCNANNGVEKGNRSLSRARAEAVKQYLVDVWGIAPERLPIIERDLPAVPSNQQTADGSAENRRVEIASNVPEVTDVLVAYDTTRSANPPMLRVKPSVRASEPIATWKLTLAQRGTILKELSGQGTPPAAIDWEIAGEDHNTPRFSEPVSIGLEVVASDGEQIASETTLATDVITVQQKHAERARDYHIEQYNLVLFDVGTSAITPSHRRTIDLVRSRLTEGSTVTIEGYSDRTGDDNANRRLARARAQSTATALGRSDASVTGIGEDRLLYDNNTPEGRFYCRTVRITVRTPVVFGGE